MILSVNYTHSSSTVHYMLIGPDGKVYVDQILPSGAQSITLPLATTPIGIYTLFAFDPADMNKVVQETVVVPDCVPVPSPSASPSITPTPSTSRQVVILPSASPTPSITVTPTVTPSPSPIYTTVITITKYSSISDNGVINIYDRNGLNVLYKRTENLAVGENTFTITPYVGLYDVSVGSIIKIADGQPGYVAISSTNGTSNSSIYGTLSVSGYGQVVNGMSNIGITLGLPSNGYY